MPHTLLPVPRFRRPRGAERFAGAMTPPDLRAVTAPYITRTRTEGPQWRVSAVCPPDWRESIERCGGGFFHTPVGLRLSTQPGEARFFEYVSPAEGTLGVAIATLRRCRFASRPRHAEFPTWPALRNHADRTLAVSRLRETLRELDIAEAVIESFDADGETVSDGDDAANERREYRVRLDGSADELLQRCTSTHRRRIRHGEREGWELRFLCGDIARDAIATVQDLASTRASQRGEGFAAASPTSDAWSAGRFGDPWGACTVGAFEGQQLLAAAVIGWANGRAFYVSGGSTVYGYEEGSAPWLHWRAMTAFQQSGGQWYNLGGAPPAAEFDGDPSHGLHRFKSGFGAERCARVGARWAIAPGHIRSHLAARWIARRATA